VEDKGYTRHVELPPVKHLTQGDIDSGEYRMTDVLIPTPGNASVLPDNEVRDYLTKILEMDGFSQDVFVNNSLRTENEFQLEGAYRALIGMPFDLEYDMIKHDNSVPDLLAARDDEIIPGDNLALRIHFSLNRGQYATMAARELSRGGVQPGMLRDTPARPRLRNF